MVRASIMGSVFLLAEALGRQRNAVSALSLAAALMTIVRATATMGRQLSAELPLNARASADFTAFNGVQFPVKPADNKYLQFIQERVDYQLRDYPGCRNHDVPHHRFCFHSFSLVSAPATFFSMPAFPGIIFTSLVTSDCRPYLAAPGLCIRLDIVAFPELLFAGNQYLQCHPFCLRPKYQYPTMADCPVLHLSMVCCLLLVKNRKSFLSLLKIYGTDSMPS